MDLNRQKIQLYCNQVFVTDSLEGVVPDFLALLQGVIDSPDIPLNVSRSPDLSVFLNSSKDKLLKCHSFVIISKEKHMRSDEKTYYINSQSQRVIRD